MLCKGQTDYFIILQFLIWIFFLNQTALWIHTFHKNTVLPVYALAFTDMVYCTPCFTGHQQIGSITQ